MTSDLDVRFFLRLFRRRGALVAAVLTTTLMAFLILYAALPNRYKSTFQITIPARYFQNPLIRDVVSEQYDTTEMRLQRESLLKQAIDDDFLDEIGERFHFYRSKPHASADLEREELRKHFEIFGLNAATFQVGFIASRPEVSQEVTRKTLSRVTKTLVDHRRKSLLNIRDAIRSRMQALALASSNRGQLQQELVRLEAQARELSIQYTERHPKMRELRARQRALRNWLSSAESRIDSLDPEALATRDIEPNTREVYADLLKKLNYLEVALGMERTSEANDYAVLQSPSFPTAPLAPHLLNFIAYGLGSGVLLSIFLLLLTEQLNEQLSGQPTRKTKEQDGKQVSPTWEIPARAPEPLPEEGANGWN
jgi:uncharacterized protein involved in exopolysaccharide biosynthesis